MYMGQKDQDGYYAEKGEFFSIKGALTHKFKNRPIQK